MPVVFPNIRQQTSSQATQHSRKDHAAAGSRRAVTALPDRRRNRRRQADLRSAGSNSISPPQTSPRDAIRIPLPQLYVEPPDETTIQVRVSGYKRS